MTTGPASSLRSGRAFVRFLLVGGLCFVSGMVVVYALTDGMGWHYLLSTLVTMLATNLMGWLLNRSWTYRSTQRRTTSEFIRYAAVNLAGMGVSLLLVGLLVSQWRLHYVVACAVVALGMAVVNFQLQGRCSLRLGRDAGR